MTQPVRLTLWVTDEPNKTVFDRTRTRARWSRPGGLPRRRSGDAEGRTISAERPEAEGAEGYEEPEAEVARGLGPTSWSSGRSTGGRAGSRSTTRGSSSATVAIRKQIMQAETEAWFGQPGEYWLRAQVNDRSGDGGRGEQCCWTNAHVKVNVR